MLTSNPRCLFSPLTSNISISVLKQLSLWFYETISSTLSEKTNLELILVVISASSETMLSALWGFFYTPSDQTLVYEIYTKRSVLNKIFCRHISSLGSVWKLLIDTSILHQYFWNRFFFQEETIIACIASISSTVCCTCIAADAQELHNTFFTIVMQFCTTLP